MKKKLQVFISSTYTDLKDERQAAVEAILDAGHIPAGMELFKAGNEDQLNTIKRWIDESDVYLLILGGRYGSVEPKSGKSYTHLEYEYALKKNIPVFATVLSDSLLHSKAAVMSANNIFEQNEPQKYKEFKDYVHSKIIRPVEDIKDIKLAIHTTLNEFIGMYEFSGWVKGNQIEEYTDILKENRELLKENKKLKELHEKHNKSEMIGKFEYIELKETLREKEFKIPVNKIGNEEVIKTNFLNIFLSLRDKFSTGIENSTSTSNELIYIYYNIAPTLMSFGLLEKVKVAGVKYERIQTTKEGLLFLAYSDMEQVKSKKESN